MSLSDELMSEPNPDEVQYHPRVVFDGGTGYIETGIVQGESPDISSILRECLVAAGHNPDDVTIGAKLRESHWQQRTACRQWSDDHSAYIRTGEFETVWLHAFKYETLLRKERAVDIESLVSAVKTTRPEGPGGPYWAIFQASDQQLGKRSREGSTEQIVERYIQSVEAAKEQFKNWAWQGIEGIQISVPGDCLEGVVSQRGGNIWLTQETITEQVRILRRLLYHTVAEFAPMANHVYLDVVNGNHDESQRVQSTYPGDGWATECAIAVDDALQTNQAAYGHVEVRVPEKWSGMMTVPVGDSVVTVAHGHQWRRGKGMEWWARQAVNNQPAGASQVLQHGHWHSWELESNEHRVRVSSSTFDCGSDWYRNTHGSTAKRGACIYLLRSGEVSNMSVV